MVSMTGETATYDINKNYWTCICDKFLSKPFMYIWHDVWYESNILYCREKRNTIIKYLDIRDNNRKWKEMIDFNIVTKLIKNAYQSNFAVLRF